MIAHRALPIFTALAASVTVPIIAGFVDSIRCHILMTNPSQTTCRRPLRVRR
jgi:hypothetical protein